MTRFERVLVWSGGALFVLSLAACGYSYLVRWVVVPAATRSALPAAIAFDTALFSVFALHHSVLARASVKARVARLVPAHLIRSLYVWTASVLLLAVLALWRPVAADLYDVAGWRAAIHAAVQLAGVWLIARSVARIDPLELAGIKPQPTALSGDVLQVAGPYRWVRHPLYLGWILVVFGAAHMTGDRLAFATISTVYLLIAIPWEERSLRHAFGAAYAEYERRVRWRVVPYVF